MQEPRINRRCKQCNYILQESNSGMCPECGRTFDLADRSTYCDTSATLWKRIKPFALATITAHFAASYFGFACYLYTAYADSGIEVFRELPEVFVFAAVSACLWAWFWVFLAGVGAIISGSNDFVGTGLEGILFLIGYLAVFVGIWLIAHSRLGRKE